MLLRWVIRVFTADGQAIQSAIVNVGFSYGTRQMIEAIFCDC